MFDWDQNNLRKIRAHRIKREEAEQALLNDFIFVRVTLIPGALLIGVWFLIQLFNAGSVATVQTGGVAYLAHVGGFIFGAVFGRLFVDPYRIAQSRRQRCHPNLRRALPPPAESQDLVRLSARRSATWRLRDNPARPLPTLRGAFSVVRNRSWLSMASG